MLPGFSTALSNNRCLMPGAVKTGGVQASVTVALSLLKSIVPKPFSEKHGVAIIDSPHGCVPIEITFLGDGAAVVRA